MKKTLVFSIALLATATISNAQDFAQANKSIDAEQYEKAKSELKAIYQAKPSNGKAAFLLGTIYLKQNVQDSAKLFFDKGVSASEFSKLNQIGLGQIDLDNNKIAEAKTKFDLVLKDTKKKDFEEYIYVAQAYMNADKPNYKAAIEVMLKAKLNHPENAKVLLALGDAYYGDKNQNDAYVAYRDAYKFDPTLIRAKMQSGVLLKGAKAYVEAEKALNEVVAANPNYGPAYRELAETYYYWANNQPKTYTQNIAKALEFYKKYMSMTDYSLSSRMRYADFLILAKEYKALEVEANKMKELDNVNPRILRYLGYAAYENGNTDLAIKSLNDYLSNPNNKIIGRDYLYLGLAKIKKGTSADGKTIDATLLKEAVAELNKAVEKEVIIVNEFNAIGAKFFEQKQYKEAASIFEVGASKSDNKNYLDDNLFYGLSVYYDNNKNGVKPNIEDLQKAEIAFDNVLKSSPNYQDAYIFKARCNRLLENDENMAKNYEAYLEKITAKGAEEMAKPSNKSKLIESYNNIGAHYANSDVTKAKEFFNKTLLLDATNAYATDSLKSLK